MPRAAACAVCVALVALAAAPLAAEPGWHVGAALAGGVGVTSRPEDGAGELTLLHGTGFQGPAVRLAVVAHRDVAPFATVGAELGYGRYQLNGFATRAGETRELTLTHAGIELLAIARVHVPLDRVRPALGFGLGPRIGLSARLRDSAAGTPGIDPAPRGARDIGFPLLIEAGAAVRVSTGWDLALRVRGAWNVAYPATTGDRLSGWSSFDDVGEYRVEHDVDVLVALEVTRALRPRD
jgi:hypothetical protein